MAESKKLGDELPLPEDELLLPNSAAVQGLLRAAKRDGRVFRLFKDTSGFRFHKDALENSCAQLRCHA